MDVAAMPAVGMSSSRGYRDLNCDIATDYAFTATGVLAATVVDGTGNSLEVSDIAFLAAHTAVRVGARKGALPGLAIYGLNLHKESSFSR